MGFRDWFKRKQQPNDLGTVLLKMHVLDAAQLTRAVEAQKAAPGGTMLGEILTGLGFISAEQLGTALRLQKELRNGKRLEATIEISQHNFHSAMKRQPSGVHRLN